MSVTLNIGIDLEDTDIFEFGVVLVSYFTEQGTMAYGIRTSGDHNLSQLLGLIEVCKARIINESTMA